MPRVCLYGAESCGKTTLSQALARLPGAAWVPEYGREYCRLVKWTETGELSPDDFQRIVEGQAALVARAAGRPARLQVFDTDSVVTRVWTRFQGCACPPAVDAAADAERWDLVALCGADVAWADDGERVEAASREWFQEQFEAEALARGFPLLRVAGPVNVRVAAVLARVRALSPPAPEQAAALSLPDTTVAKDRPRPERALPADLPPAAADLPRAVRWRRRPCAPLRPRHGAVVALVGDAVTVAGGSALHDWFEDAYRVSAGDGGVDAREIDPVPQRTGATLTPTEEGEALLFGGREAGGSSARYRNGVFLHDGASWQHLDRCRGRSPRGRSGHCALWRDGSLWVFFGFTGRFFVDDVFRFELAARCWHEMESRSLSPVGRTESAAVAVGPDTALFFGGETAPSVRIAEGKHFRVLYLGDLLAYDFAERTWSEVRVAAGAPPCARSSHVAAALPGARMLVHGGMTWHFQALADTHVFCYASRTWARLEAAGPLAPLPRCHAQGAALVGGGGLLVVGGYGYDAEDQDGGDGPCPWDDGFYRYGDVWEAELLPLAEAADGDGGPPPCRPGQTASLNPIFSFGVCFAQSGPCAARARLASDAPDAPLLLELECAHGGTALSAPASSAERRGDSLYVRAQLRVDGATVGLSAALDWTTLAGVGGLQPLEAAAHSGVALQYPSTEGDGEGFLGRFIALTRKRPHRPLLVDDDGEHVTAQCLLMRALLVARRLRDGLGVGKGDLVGLAMGASAAYVTALLGVWLAGAAFVPLDPAQPAARLERMRAAAEPRAVLSAADVAACFAGQTATVVAEAPPYRPERRAYVVFTSGSSGEPKGVEVAHRGLLPFLDAQIDAFQLDESARVLQFLPVGFDASLSEIGTALLSGATLFCAAAPAKLSHARLAGLLAAAQISHACLPPALLPQLPPAQLPVCFRVVVIGGEVCPPAAVRAWAVFVRVVVVYGPTEATVATTLAVAGTDWERPLLGRPVPSASLLVQGEEEDGELLILGDCLALGYWRDPEATARAFVTLPDGRRAYRSGDRVRRVDGGDLEFLGRLDQQVQIRGNRVEPAEVAAALCEHAAVSNAIVTVSADGELVAHVAAPVGAAELREFALERLPPYMVPAQWEVVGALPVNANGKLDPSGTPSGTPSGGGSGSGSGTKASVLLRLWRAALGDDSLSPEDNVFLSGASSLDVLRVVAEAEQAGLLVAPGAVFQAPTVRQLAEAAAWSSSANVPAPAEAETLADWFADPGVAADEVGDVLIRPSLEWLATPPELELAAGEPSTDVLVTGATGFLGSRLVAALEAAGRTVVPLSRSTGHDVSQPRFGLDEPAYRALAARVGTVVHCAAVVDMVRPFNELRDANVDGTAQVLRFCAAAGGARLVYASTLSVFVAAEPAVPVVTEAHSLDDTWCVHGGYAQTKWVAERMVARSGARAAVVRLGLLTAPRATDQLALFLRGLAELGAAPDDGGRGLCVDVTPVDYAARAMAAVALDDGCEGVFHVANPQPLPLAELVAQAREAGLTLHSVPAAEWVAAARAASGRSEAVAAAALALGRLLAPADFAAVRPVDLFQATGVRFCVERAAALVGGPCGPPDVRGLVGELFRLGLLSGTVGGAAAADDFGGVCAPLTVDWAFEAELPEAGEPRADRYDVFCYKAHEVPGIVRDVCALAVGGRRLLDMGCGTGRLLRPLAAAGWAVTGADPDADYCARARLRAPAGVDVLPIGFEQLEAAGEFDVVLAVNAPWLYVLEPAAREDALRRVLRALRPGGALLLDQPNLLFHAREYPEPSAPQTRAVRGEAVRRTSAIAVDYEAGVWEHRDWFCPAAGAGMVEEVHRFAIVPTPLVVRELERAGFERVSSAGSTERRQRVVGFAP